MYFATNFIIKSSYIVHRKSLFFFFLSQRVHKTFCWCFWLYVVWEFLFFYTFAAADFCLWKLGQRKHVLCYDVFFQPRFTILSIYCTSCRDIIDIIEKRKIISEICSTWNIDLTRCPIICSLQEKLLYQQD
jgi:hypothetical protein